MNKKQKLAWRRRLDGLVTVLMLVVSVVALWAFLRRPVGGTDDLELPKGPLSLGSLMSVGDTTADVVIVLFSDFQCPFCADFAISEMPELKAEVERERRALLQFAHFPLDSIHPAARFAGEAVECARHQLLEWQLHDRLFARTAAGQLRTRDDVIAVVKQVDKGGDFAIESCLDAGVETPELQNQIGLAKLLGVRSTPTFVIGRRTDSGFHPSKRVVGAVGVETLLAHINDLVKAR